MKIVAFSGEKSNPDAYLIHVGEGSGWDELGHVVDMNRRVKFPLFNLQSILSRGYWEEIEHDEELMEDLINYPEEEGNTR